MHVQDFDLCKVFPLSFEDLDLIACTLILDLLFLVVNPGVGDPNKPQVKEHHSMIMSMRHY